MAAVDIPSHMRIEPGSQNVPFGKWPESAKSTDVDVNAVAKDVTDRLNQTLSKKDFAALVDLFVPGDCYWRDHLANSWEFRTIKGKDNIRAFLAEGCKVEKVQVDDSSAFRAPHLGAYDGGDVRGVEFFVTFESTIGRGQGVCRLVEYNGKWLIWCFFLALRELKGREEPLLHRRPTGVTHGTDTGRKNWQDRRFEEENFISSDPAVLIVGAGQGGLSVAARLKMLEVPALIVDMNDRVGDNWRRRYAALVLHDPVWFDHLPYINFPPHWPIFTPKDKLADWFESYAKTLELNVWMKTKIDSSSYDDEKRQWTVSLTRTKPDGTTEKRTLHPRHIIQATGHSGKKNMPDIKGMSDFRGDRIVHSSEFDGAKPLDNKTDNKPKKAVVVGACNSAHDICQEYLEKGYDVTMVQRSSTCVVSVAAVVNIGLAGLYDETGPPVDDADTWLFATPGEILKLLQSKVAELQAQHDEKILQGLRRAGFQCDRGIDDAGLLWKYLSRGGGYYIDVGASQSIIDGKIKMKSGQEIQEITSDGLRFADGTELPADEIILATGYQNMRTEARSIFGDEVYERVGDMWGFDDEGEMRVVWQKSGHPGYWFMGGNLALCRYFSRPLALQIKALEDGLCVYGDR